MPGFEVTVSEMYNAASKIHQAAEDYLAAACKVYAIAEVLGQSWEGDSQIAFMAEQQKAKEWFTKMAALVESYLQMIQRAAKAYQAADERAASGIRDGNGAGGAGVGVIRDWNRIQMPPIMTLYAAPNALNLNSSTLVSSLF